MNDFQQLWALLRQHGSSAKRETECAALWASYTPDVQQRVYTAIRAKLDQGKFVHYDPLRAMEENARAPRQQTLSYAEKNWCRIWSSPFIARWEGNFLTRSLFV